MNYGKNRNILVLLVLCGILCSQGHHVCFAGQQNLSPRIIINSGSEINTWLQAASKLGEFAIYLRTINREDNYQLFKGDIRAQLQLALQMLNKLNKKPSQRQATDDIRERLHLVYSLLREVNIGNRLNFVKTVDDKWRDIKTTVRPMLFKQLSRQEEEDVCRELVRSSIVLIKQILSYLDTSIKSEDAGVAGKRMFSFWKKSLGRFNKTLILTKTILEGAGDPYESIPDAVSQIIAASSLTIHSAQQRMPSKVKQMRAELNRSLRGLENIKSEIMAWSFKKEKMLALNLTIRLREILWDLEQLLEPRDTERLSAAGLSQYTDIIALLKAFNAARKSANSYLDDETMTSVGSRFVPVFEFLPTQANGARMLLQAWLDDEGQAESRNRLILTEFIKESVVTLNNLETVLRYGVIEKIRSVSPGRVDTVFRINPKKLYRVGAAILTEQAI